MAEQPMSLARILSQINADRQRPLDRLFDLLRIQSISTDGAYEKECEKECENAADWLVTDLKSIGFKAKKGTPLASPLFLPTAARVIGIFCSMAIVMCNQLIQSNYGIIHRSSQ